MAPGYRKDAYSAAIDKVRSEHSDSIKAASVTVECPRCKTKQVITETPGMRTCVKCGFEFRPLQQR
jgi:ribosomal protein L37AE/L43A